MATPRARARRLWLRPALLAALVLRCLGDDWLPGPNWGFDSYEITVPERLGAGSGARGAARPLSYRLRLEGRRLVVRLWPKKSLLPRSLPVFSFGERGELREDHPSLPSDCGYLGAVEGSRDSAATLTTCLGGLRGVLSLDARHYQIEPLGPSATFEHVVYLLKKEQPDNRTCGVVDEEPGEEGAARAPSSYPAYGHRKYLELVMVFDQTRFRVVDSNLSRVVDDAILLAAIMDTYYQDVNLRIHLKALEVWTDHNRIFVGFPTLAEVLGKFVLYKQSSLSTRAPSDWAHLYVSRTYRDALAWSWGRVCESVHAGSASSFPDANVLGPATWSAHEVGHSLGMRHDQAFCQCRGRKSCVMGTGRGGFSNCSCEAYFRFVSVAAECVNDLPGRGYVVARCGNQVVEEDEACDCGSREDCGRDACCQPDCRLRPGASCASGLCCHGCRFLPSGSVCRQAEGECDLAEYCNGTSSLCPEDAYKQDGTPCKHEGLCFGKGCRSRRLQCRSLFGPDATEAPPRCYQVVNAVGDQYGNCAITGVAQYQRCAQENALCGRLQCANVERVPDLPEHTTVVATYLRADDVVCWGTGYHLAMRPHGIPDVGAINDGTSCGPNQVCVNRTCVNSSVLQFDCSPETCNGRGICNHKKNCHCVYGWAPPLCEEPGFGGSVDSGPPGLKTEERPAPQQGVYFLLLRTILFAISVVVVFFRQRIVRSLNGVPESSERMSENVTQ